MVNDFPTAQGGNAVIGSAMYNVVYTVNAGDYTPHDVTMQRIGGGWDRMIAYVHAQTQTSTTTFRRYEYAMRDDGVLMRWSVSSDVHNQQT